MSNPTKPALIAASLDTPPGVSSLELRKPIVFKTPADLDALAADLGVISRQIYDVCIVVGDETTVITNGADKVIWRAPRTMTVTGVRASLAIYGNDDVEIVVRVNSVPILSANLLIPFASTTSDDDGAGPTVSHPAIVANDLITVDIVAHGVTATGLKIYILGHL